MDRRHRWEVEEEGELETRYRCRVCGRRAKVMTGKGHMRLMVETAKAVMPGLVERMYRPSAVFRTVMGGRG